MCVPHSPKTRSISAVSRLYLGRISDLPLEGHVHVRAPLPQDTVDLGAEGDVEEGKKEEPPDDYRLIAELIAE